MTLSAVQAQTRATNISGASPADRQAAGFAAALAKYAKQLDEQTHSLASQIQPAARPAPPTPATLRSDGATEIWTGVPQSIAVTHPAQLNAQANALPVSKQLVDAVSPASRTA